ncbi:MAG: outer membrane protein transport protein [Bacteroidia bacterium]|nr:outer membrane protein transport protein [Bacteroidia bacterium]
MKKIAYFIFTLMFFANYSYSQGEVEALNYSRNELYGTARSMAMGNAFGALGGDITGVFINPAGIGVYRSSEVVGTLGFMQNNANVGDINKNISDLSLHNLGFVGYFPLRNDVMPMINFGFSFNRQKTMKNEINGVGDGASSMVDYIVDRSYGINPVNLEMGENKPDPFLGPDWLSVLAFNSWLINEHQAANGDYYYTPLNTGSGAPRQEIILSQRGYIDNYDFTIGTTLNNVLNIGLALNIFDISHYLFTDFLEDFNNSGGYTLNNEITTSGAGVGAKLGVIYRPVNAFRIGLAYHTPTWYSMSEIYQARLDDDLGAFVTDPDYEKGWVNSAKFRNDYNLKTPDKWVLSAAAVLGSNFILSADYELMNYTNMKLSVPSRPNLTEEQKEIDAHWYDEDNSYIKKDFKAASTVKVGAEYRFTPQFSGRLGYAWMQNPYDADFAQAGDAGISGSNTIYRIEGDTNYFTGGLGYRFNRNFYADLAVVYQTQEDQLYPFPNLYNYNGDTRGELVIDASPFALKNTSVRGLLTLGYRF